MYIVFNICSLPQDLVKTLAKKLVKNLTKNLVKNLAKKTPKSKTVVVSKGRITCYHYMSDRTYLVGVRGGLAPNGIHIFFLCALEGDRMLIRRPSVRPSGRPRPRRGGP